MKYIFATSLAFLTSVPASPITLKNAIPFFDFNSESISDYQGTQSNGGDERDDKTVKEGYKRFREALTLEVLEEHKFEDLFVDDKGITKWEASAITSGEIGKKDSYYVIFDNLHVLAEVNELAEKSPKNLLFGESGEDSGYEGIQYDKVKNLFYVLIENQPHSPSPLDFSRYDDNTGHSDEESDGDDYETDERLEKPKKHKKHKGLKETFRPVIVETNIYPNGTTQIKDKCKVYKDMPSSNKGFEGIVYYDDPQTGNIYMLGLCEGNHCLGGKKGRESGNGIIVVAKKVQYDNTCAWEVVGEIQLPHYVDFIDYSGITANADYSKIAIISQENSMMWLVDVKLDIVVLADNENHFSVQLENLPGNFFKFPRNHLNQMIYCNVEGINFISDTEFLAVSDKMKGGAKQPARCGPKDQSIHRVTLPNGQKKEA